MCLVSVLALSPVVGLLPADCAENVPCEQLVTMVAVIEQAFCFSARLDAAVFAEIRLYRRFEGPAGCRCLNRR